MILLPQLRWLPALALLSIVAAPCHSQEAATNRYEFRAKHDPNGIGKFYFGREIAYVMGHQAANWLERTNREDEERSELMIDLLKLKPGDVVADIGAGTGYHSRRMALKVGATGRILAVDVQPEMLEILTNKMAELKITNVSPILGTVTDPKLPAAAVDLILLVDVYHEFDYPYEMMTAMCRALKPGGRLVFVEFRGEDSAVPIKAVHKMTEAQVRRETAGHPLVWVETKRELPWQHVIIFKRKESGRAAPPG